MLNRALHREERNSVKTSTLEDWVESYGEALSEGYRSRAEDILDSYNVDRQSGIISEESHLSSSVLKPDLPAVVAEKQARQLITEYNRGRDRMTKLKYDASTSGIEDGTQRCCYISVDDIGVRFQKPERKGKCKKNRAFIENTVIHWRRKWQPTPVLLPGESHGWRSPVGYSPWGHKESGTTERLHFVSFF